MSWGRRSPSRFSILLRRGSRLSVPLAWVVVVEFIASLAFSVVTGALGHLLGTTTALSWVQVVLFQPVLVIACVLQVRQLVSRRGKPLSTVSRIDPGVSGDRSIGQEKLDVVGGMP